MKDAKWQSHVMDIIVANLAKNEQPIEQVYHTQICCLQIII